MVSQLIRNSLLATALALPLLPLANQSALAIDRRDFVVYNNNELEIDRLYVSPSDSRYWRSDILDSVLLSGDVATVSFPNNSNYCSYDIKAVYSNGTYDIGRYNLCQTKAVTFYGHGGDYRSSR